MSDTSYSFSGKKVVYVTGETVPTFRHNGSTLATIGLSLSLLREAGELVVVSYKQTMDQSPADVPRELEEFGIRLLVLQGSGKEGGEFGEDRYLNEFQDFLADFKPDVLIGYDWSAVGLIAKSRFDGLKISLTCDLRHLAVWGRAINYFRKKRSLRNKLYNFRKAIGEYFKTRSVEVSVLKDFDLNINHAHHHAGWLQKRGADVKYLPQFIQIPTSQYAEFPIEQSPLKIMLAGSVDGVISMRGLEMLIFNIIPALKDKLKIPFQINYYGHYNPENFSHKLSEALEKHADVFSFQGFKPLKEALMNHHIFMIPNNITLGFRTRIVEGMAYGSCMIAHKANTLGMPELKNGENIFIAETGEEFSEAIHRLSESPALYDKIRKEALRTYRETYHADVTLHRLYKLASGQ